MTQKEERHEKKQDEQRAEEIARLEERCKALEEEKQNLFEQLQRLSADYANYQKRTMRQIAEAVAYEKRNLLRAWVSSLDNLEHALASVSSQSGPDALPKLKEGMQLVYEHMLASLQSQGVRKMEPVGQPFTPGPHEALMTCERPDQADQIVLEVHQSGYLLGEDVLRPAKVVVNKLPAGAEAQEKADTPPADKTGLDSDSAPSQENQSSQES